MRPSPTTVSSRERGRSASAPRRRRSVALPVKVRVPAWSAPGWPLSLAFFLIPLALVIATLAHRSTAEAPRLVVSDRLTGAPVPGARVTVGSRSLTTNEAGEVEVEIDAGSGPIALGVLSDGYAPVGGTIDPGSAGRVAVALRPTTVRGRLTDIETGAPIPGASVSAVSTNGAGVAVQTSASGDYELRDVPEKARLRFDAGEYGVIEEAVAAGGRLDKALRRTIVTGIVRDAVGAPIAGATIGVPGGAAFATTGADGAYRLAGAGEAGEVLVRAPGFTDQRLALPADRRLEVALQGEQIKAVYANSGTLGDPARLGRLIEIADTTEVNAIVIDVKQDTIYYESEVPFFRDVPGMITPIYDPAELLATLDEHNIYAIARMVVFKDPVVAEARPDLAVKDEVSGGSWRDMNGTAWVNAFKKELWQANADLALELANLGFDEIQYDYIRFPSDGDLTTADFGPDYSEEARRGAIRGAVAMGSEAIRPTGARFAIDLFPIIALQGNDQGIGQTLQDLTPLADSVNLMIYPSHYEEGNIPVDGHPNDFPAETVAYTLERAEELVPGSMPKMRPWLQDFDYPGAGYTTYGPAEVRAQIDAAEQAGASGWLLWNAAGEFQVEALAPEA